MVYTETITQLPTSEPSPPASTTSGSIDKGVFALPPANPSTVILSSAFSDDDPPALDFSSSDDDSSVSSDDSSQASLFTPCDDFFTPPPAAPASLRRAANPTVLNDDWRTFFRNALTTRPVEPSNAAEPTPYSLPPPLTSATNLPCGHPFLTDHGGFRVWSNNINGLSCENGFAALHELCIALKPHNIGAIALQETNLDFTKQWVRDQVESILAEHFGTVRLVTSTSCVHSPSAWKPGGVL
jgi:hypothetical protein